ncbi:hypothetical protein B0A67_20855 [Flavobacterium aquidurense]|nr:hypothetical protein B0A67_20855 [Flavobacterium aquidurense]
MFAAAKTISSSLIYYLVGFKELFPAIRFNLLLFKEKSKRISTTIRARTFGVKKGVYYPNRFPKPVRIKNLES